MDEEILNPQITDHAAAFHKTQKKEVEKKKEEGFLISEIALEEERREMLEKDEKALPGNPLI